ncbi:MAG: hypothetical protein EA353_09175, partial [Puniceicoccaceae bacterium]
MYPEIRLPKAVAAAVCLFTVLICSSAVLTARPAPIKSSFEEAFEELPSRHDDKNITGALPRPWADNSSWADVDVRYSRIPEGFDSPGALRVDVDAVRDGRVQVVIPDVKLDGKHFIEITLATRSSTGINATLELRQAGAPYRSYSSTALNARPEWSTQTIRVPPAAADPSSLLMLGLASTGSIEIDAVHLRYLTPEEALGDRDYTGNLLFNSSFADGVPAPWALAGNLKPEDAYVVDSEMIGPTGVPSLRMKSFQDGGRPVAGLTSPFFGKQGHTHTFSFWAKAERPFNLFIRMGPPDATLYRAPFQKEISLTTEWKRHEFTLELPYSSSGFYIARLMTHNEGTAWIDGMMVEAGNQATRFQRPGPGNVELALYPANHYSLFETGETMEARMAIYGDIPSGARIRGLLIDPNGRRHLLDDRPVNAGDFGKTTFPLPEALTEMNGTYLLNMQLIDRSDKLLGKLSELLLHRIRPARHFGELAPDSAFATHVHANAINAEMAKRLGFNAIRSVYSFNWATVYDRGNWNWERTDKFVDNAEAHHLEIMGYFGGVPMQYSHAERNWRSWSHVTSPPLPEYMDNFGDYMERIMSRYEGRIQQWEIYNEPFLAGFFPVDDIDGRPVRGEPELLMMIAHQAMEARERSGTSAKLLWNSGLHYDTGLDFDTALIEKGILDYVDGVTMHQYSNTQLAAPGDRFEQIAKLYRKKIFDDHDMPLWNSEGGRGPILINHYRSFPPEDLQSAAETLADNIVRYYIANLSNQITKVYNYGFFEADSWRPDYTYNN